MMRQRLTMMLGPAVLLVAGCAGAPQPEAPAPVPVPPVTEEPPVEAVETAEQLDEKRQALAAERLRSIDLEQQLVQLRAALTEAEAKYGSLEEELARSLDEVLRAKASIRGVHSRALATSRIAEVRVELDAESRDSTAPLAPEFERATGLLVRADEELGSENYGGAVYLAEKASGLVSQARSAAPAIRAEAPQTPVVPVMPPVPRLTNSPTNLRQGPGTDFSRKGLIPAGEPVSVLAAAGDWRHIERSLGERGWVHSRLLDAPAAADGGTGSDSATMSEVWESTDRVNLRVGPGLEHERVLVLSRGETVRATSADGEWLQVERADGQTGWVYAPLMRRTQ